MKTRRRVLLVMGLFLFGAVVTLWLVVRGNTGAKVEVIFIGFTNELLVPISQIALEQRYLYSDIMSDSEFGPDGVYAPVALLLATNTGTVPVEIVAAIWPDSSLMPDYVPPLANGLPPGLKPGEAAVVRVPINPGRNPWWTELSYRRHGLRERVYAWAWNSGNSTLQGWVAPLFSNFTRARCGPITSQLPGSLLTFGFDDYFSAFSTMIWPNTTNLPVIRLRQFAVPRPSVKPKLEDLLKRPEKIRD